MYITQRVELICFIEQLLIELIKSIIALIVNVRHK